MLIFVQTPKIHFIIIYRFSKLYKHLFSDKRTKNFLYPSHTYALSSTVFNVKLCLVYQYRCTTFYFPFYLLTEKKIQL